MRSLLLLTGVLLALWTPELLLEPLRWLLLATAPLLLLRPRWRAGLLLVAGFLYSQWTAHRIESPAVASTERQLIRARVESIPAKDSSGWQFDAMVSFPRQPQLISQRVRLSMPQAQAPQVGETWQFAAQFSTSPSAMQARALLRDHISSRARIIAGPLNQRETAASWGIDRLRAQVAARIDARVADPSAAALLAALAVGATGDVSSRQWRVFNATGITHLVAISGMHVTFFAMLSMALARMLWRRIPLLARHIRREVFAAATGVLLALAYALLSGFSVPAQRTVVMLAAFLLVRECARASTPAWSVGAALTLVLLYDPMAALSAGFWLSFGAVASIVLMAGARLQPGSAVHAAVHVQLLVTLALLPATLAIFGSFSAVGVLANAIAIPVFTFLLVPPVLVATLGYLIAWTPAQWCGDQLVDLAAAVAGLLWPVLARCAEVTGAMWYAAAPQGWYFVALPALLLVLAPWTRGIRVVALASLCSVFLLREPRPAAGELWLDMLDVGASSAVVLRTRNHLLLYGTGEKFGSRGRSFDSQVLPLLRRVGYPAVDLWLPGNLGRDVQAALARATALLPLTRVELAPGVSAPPELSTCQPRTWNWDGIEFTIATHASFKGCLLRATINGQQLELASETGRGVGALPATEKPPVLLVPRSASAAAAHHPAAGMLLLASVSQSEWESASWSRLRRQWASDGITVLATATEGSIRLRIGTDGRLRKRILRL